jgi:hypothetical protein
MYCAIYEIIINISYDVANPNPLVRQTTTTTSLLLKYRFHFLVKGISQVAILSYFYR